MEHAIFSSKAPLSKIFFKYIVELNPFGIALIKYFHNFYLQILISANIMIQNKSN